MPVDFIDRHGQILWRAQHRAAKFQDFNRRHRYPKVKQGTNLRIELAGGVEGTPSTDRFSRIYMSARKLKSNWRGRHLIEMLNRRQYHRAPASRDQLSVGVKLGTGEKILKDSSATVMCGSGRFRSSYH